MDTLSGRLQASAEQVRGANVAIVYAHSFDSNLLAKHYLKQRTETLAGYADVIDLLGGYPVFFNIEQFLDLSINPEKYKKIDFAINVPGGSLELSNLLLPAVLAAKMGKAIFPSSAPTIAIGQNKPIASKVAKGLGWVVPKEFNSFAEADAKGSYIIKPRCAGDSYGVRRLSVGSTSFEEVQEGEFVQEFIQGYDLTSYLIMSPINNQYKVIRSSITIPREQENRDWFWDVQAKFASSGRGIERFTDSEMKRVAASTAECFNGACARLAMSLGVTTLARIDARLSEIPKPDCPIRLKDVHFLEINVLPSITPSGSWAEHLVTYLNQSGVQPKEIHELFDMLPAMQSAMLFFLLCWITYYTDAPTTGVDQLK